MSGKSTAPTPAPEAELRDLLARWDTFLAKIQARFAEAKREAIDAVLGQLVDTDYDVAAVLTTTVAVEAQFRDLAQKIDATWDRIGPRVEALGGFDVYLEATEKGRTLGTRLRRQTRHLRAEIDGRVAEAYWAHARPLMDAPFACSQCGGRLEPQRDTFGSHYVTCPYCQTVNTYLPHSKVSKLAWYGADMMAAWRVLPERAQLEDLELASSTLRYDADDAERARLTADVQAARRHYQGRYHDERIAIWPAYAKTRDADIAREMAKYESR